MCHNQCLRYNPLQQTNVWRRQNFIYNICYLCTSHNKHLTKNRSKVLMSPITLSCPRDLPAAVSWEQANCRCLVLILWTCSVWTGLLKVIKMGYENCMSFFWSFFLQNRWFLSTPYMYRLKWNVNLFHQWAEHIESLEGLCIHSSLLPSYLSIILSFLSSCHPSIKNK